MKKQSPVNIKRGPRPENVKIRGSWENAVRRSLQKKKPLEGWPKENKSS
jgi:hypothetical protein